jgi:MFS family permease
MTPKTPHVHRWHAFALLAVPYVMRTVDLTVVDVSLPTTGRGLRFSAASLQWVVTVYALGYGGFLLLGGRAADRFGRRRFPMTALGTYTAAPLGGALAPSDPALISSRAIHGLGAAVTLPTAMPIVTSIFEEGAGRSKAFGIWGALGATVATIGLLTGGLITRSIGWQYIFNLTVPIGMLALVLAPGLLRRCASRATSRRFDLPGALVGAGGLVVLANAISQAPANGWGATRTIALLAAAVALLAAFVVIENRTESPILPPPIFRVPPACGRDRCRFPGHLGNPNPGPRALSGEPGRPACACRRWDGVLVHPNLDRRARRRPPAPGGARVRADEHLHPIRGSSRDRDRVRRRRNPSSGPAPHGRRRPHGARCRLPRGDVPAGSDRAARPPATYALIRRNCTGKLPHGDPVGAAHPPSAATS